MKVKYSQSKGSRLSKSTHKNRSLWIEPVGLNWWFDLEAGEWVDHYPSGKRCCSSYYSLLTDGFHKVWSIKAAKRLIYKWNVPSGTWFKINLPWKGHTIKIKKT